MEIKKGMTVWLTGSRIRNSGELKEGVITSIGHKYIGVRAGYEDLKFHKESLRQVTDYTPFWALWLSKEAYEHSTERTALMADLRKRFSTYSDLDLTNDQMSRIIKICDEPKTT